MYALAKANQLEQEVTIGGEVIGAQYFECPDIECGAVFSYCRVSCGRFVQPEFCPDCGGPMKDCDFSNERQLQDQPGQHLLGCAFRGANSEAPSAQHRIDQSIPLRFHRIIAGSR